MREFRIKPEGFAEIRRRSLKRAIPMMLLSVIVGIWISLNNSNSNPEQVNVLPFVIPLAAVAVSVGIAIGIKRQKRLVESFTLKLDSNMISREQIDTPKISMYFDEVREIVKNRDGSLIIKGRDATNVINIPPQIENYIELETELSRIKAIVPQGEELFFRRNQSFISLVTLGLMACVYMVENRIAVLVSGVLLVLLMGWSLYEVQTSKNIDDKTKRGTWLILLVLASVIGIMYFKLTGI